MWVFTQDGFVSAVASDRDPEVLVVRARDKVSLSLLAEVTGSDIVELPGRDYEYRVFVTRDQFSSWLMSQADAIDYSNFKNRLWQTRGDVYHDAASNVWGEMLSVSDKYRVPTKRR